MSNRFTSLAKRLFRRFTTKKTSGVPNLLRFRPRLEQCEDRTVPATLSGNLWLDYNENGTREAGEPNAAGVTVELFDRDEQYAPGFGEYATAITDLGGNFTFSNLDGGDFYTLYFSSANHTFTEPNPWIEVEVPTSSSSVEIDYGVGAIAPPTMTVAKIADATEGGTAGTFRFTRTGDTYSSLTANFTVSGTATSGSDFTALGTSVTFGYGQSTADVTLTASADNRVEGTETVTLTLGTGSGYTVGTANTAAADIADDPPVVSVTATDATEGGATGSFVFTRSGGKLGEALTVTYYVGGTATNGIDFTALNGALAFAAGQPTVTVQVIPMDDAVAETTEAIELTLQNGDDYTVGSADVAVLTIADNEQPLVTVQSLHNALEGEWVGAFGFQRLGDLSSALTLQYTTSGSATAGTDYTALGGTVNFAAGESFSAVDVVALTDTTADPNETVVVTILNSVNYVIGSGTATVTINETAPVVWIENTQSSVSEGNSTTLTIRRSGATSEALTVAVWVGTGENAPTRYGYDYHVLGRLSEWSGWGQATFAAGQDSLTLTVIAHQDEDTEATEELRVSLGAGDGLSYLLGNVTSTTIFLINAAPGAPAADPEADKPLTAQQANLLKQHLEHLAAGKTKTPLQLAEINKWIARLSKYGVESEGIERLNQLSGLLGAVTKLADKAPVVGLAVDKYKDLTNGILSGIDIARENEYVKFKQQMQDQIGPKAQERYNEIKNGFVAEWIEYHWVRYQAEKLKAKLDAK